MQTGLLVDKGTYGPCIMVGGPLWSTGNSLTEKLLSSLVSVVAAWFCLSCTNWLAFASPLPLWYYLYNICNYAIIKTIFSQRNVYIVIIGQVYVRNYMSLLQIT